LELQEIEAFLPAELFHFTPNTLTINMIVQIWAKTWHARIFLYLKEER